MDTEYILNPFVVGKYVSAEYFCDRDHEKDFLIKQIENGRNVALIADRRLGKTGLINFVFDQDVIKKKYNTFFIDIYATTSLSEFVYLLGKNIYENLQKEKSLKKKFFEIMKSFRIGFKLNPVSGEPLLDLGLGDMGRRNISMPPHAIFFALTRSAAK